MVNSEEKILMGFVYRVLWILKSLVKRFVWNHYYSIIIFTFYLEKCKNCLKGIHRCNHVHWRCNWPVLYIVCPVEGALVVVFSQSSYMFIDYNRICSVWYSSKEQNVEYGTGLKIYPVAKRTMHRDINSSKIWIGRYWRRWYF